MKLPAPATTAIEIAYDVSRSAPIAVRISAGPSMPNLVRS
jgi:hypothetical protein